LDDLDREFREALAAPLALLPLSGTRWALLLTLLLLLLLLLLGVALVQVVVVRRALLVALVWLARSSLPLVWVLLRLVRVSGAGAV
jgi:hypothetical protein